MNFLQQSKEDEKSAVLAARARSGDYDDGEHQLCYCHVLSYRLLLIILDLILEQLARNRVFLQDDGLSKLRSAFVIVVGLGGVGSHATAALARSGVSKIRVIDFDQVTLSSLNRHAVATLADVGTPKVTCIRKRLEQVTPWVRFDCRNELFGKDVAQTQLAPWNGQRPTFVIDAIDNIDSKVELLHYCHQNDIPVISSMGAGCKSDPTRILVGDISTSTDDPLSRQTRRRLKLLGVATGIPVVFSAEKTAPGKAQLLPLPEEEFQKGDVKELGVLPDFRVRILPVLGTMPATFGLCVANHVMLEISGYPHEYLQGKYREKMYDSILNGLQGTEERLVRHAGLDAQGLRLPVMQEDVAYLIEDVYRGKSVVSSLPTRLALIRWRKPGDEPLFDLSYPKQKSSKLRLNDLVCMTREEANKHEKEVLKGDSRPEDLYSNDVIDLVSHKMEEEQAYSQQRT